ncbi:MAG: hypothetical protein JNJ59_06980 [Deltaproteobacteria bacterium]|jgi:hypothetical protein|nr:hypothetical protein [Deltaproteobacteria bacterium]
MKQHNQKTAKKDAKKAGKKPGDATKAAPPQTEATRQTLANMNKGPAKGGR